MLAAGDEALWVANPLTGTVSRVDPGRGVVTATVPLGAADEPVALAVGAGGVWVANRRAQTLARIDPERAVVTERFPLGSEPRALAVVDGRLWVAVAATGAGHRGGTLRVDFQGPSWDCRFGRQGRVRPGDQLLPRYGRLLSLTNDGLTAFRWVGGTAGTDLVPDLAEAIPTPSDGGRTYTFTVRDSVRFSTGQPVRPSDIKRGIERSLNAEQAAYGLLDGIKSIAADDANRTIVIRLDAPIRTSSTGSRSLRRRGAARNGAAAAHRGGDGALPDRAARARRRVRLERNRFYRTWSALAKPDGYPDAIDVRLGVSARRGHRGHPSRPHGCGRSCIGLPRARRAATA